KRPAVARKRTRPARKRETVDREPKRLARKRWAAARKRNWLARKAIPAMRGLCRPGRKHGWLARKGKRLARKSISLAHDPPSPAAGPFPLAARPAPPAYTRPRSQSGGGPGEPGDRGTAGGPAQVRQRARLGTVPFAKEPGRVPFHRGGRGAGALPVADR